MAKTISATLGERMKAVEMLNTGQFNNLTLAAVLEDIKKFVVTPDEWKAANLRKTPTDEEVARMDAETRKNAQQIWNWDEVSPKEIELAQETVDALRSMITKKSEANELKISDGAVLSLEAKLK